MKAPLMLSAVLGALTLALFGGPLGSVFAYQGAPVVRAPSLTIELDRTRKGDRRPAEVAPASSTIGKTQPGPNDLRLAPVKLGDCEPLASPVADAGLGQWAARCVV